MPGSDGFEALELLRQCRSKARTIVLSAVDEPESRRRAIELGALAFVSKAQPLDELSSALETAAALIRAIDSQLDDA